MATSILPRQTLRACARVSPLITRPLVQRPGSCRSLYISGLHVSSPSLRASPASLLKYRAYSTSPIKQQTPGTPTEPIANEPTSRIGKFIKFSKDLISFYKTGLKLLWANGKTAKALKQKVQNEGYNLNRAEFQLVRNSHKDMLKLIPFGIVFMILPESIPLLVMYVPGAVPSTCLKESQVIKQREKLDKVRQNMSKNVIMSADSIEGISPEDFLNPRTFAKTAKAYNYDFELTRIDRAHLSSYCRFMGLSGWGTQGILQKRLNKHLDYLLEDDKLIVKEGIETLALPELQQAAEERGVRSIDASEDSLRRAIKYWIAVTSMDPPVSRGLIIFSRMFLLNANYK
ncbi:LETM1-like protein-domain-containing protein [Phycomyces nitens]|nr:LETM1-like protein-domain-containing protein [Phycomyces nitens]